MSGYKTYDTSNGFGKRNEWKKTFHTRMTGDEARIIMEGQTDTPHEILGVHMGATQSEIKAAYRKLMHRWHPDKNPGDKETAETMSKKIIAAYTILKS